MTATGQDGDAVSTDPLIGQSQDTLEVLHSSSDNPSAFLALNRGNSLFTVPGIEGFVAHREAGRFLIGFGAPFAPPEDRARLLTAFLDHAGSRRRVLAVQLQRADAELYARHGFAVNQLGASYALDLTTFSLGGKKFMQLRNKVSRARRCGLTVTQTSPDDNGEAVATIDRSWLRGKGRHVKELEFLVGELGGPAQRHRRFFLAEVAGRPVAYISYSPVFGSRPGWLHDLSRRGADAPPGTMEAINVQAVEAFRAERAGWLHFGFTPFTGLDPALEVAGASPAVASVVRFLAAHGERIYPARTQLAYKEKWAPGTVLPEYLAFQGRPSAGAVWQVLRVTRSV